MSNEAIVGAKASINESDLGRLANAMKEEPCAPPQRRGPGPRIATFIRDGVCYTPPTGEAMKERGEKRGKKRAG